MFDNTIQDTQIQALSRKLFVVHFWQNLSIIGADGSLFNLDTKILDVDGENPVTDPATNRVSSGGVGFLKRLRLLPVSATQRPIISNVAGFSSTNMFQGALDASGKPSGLGSMMGTSSKTNVRPEWSYPEQKIHDMVYTFGKYGLVDVRCLAANDAAEYMRARTIFSAVMAGVVSKEGRDQTLLEDMPEYFGEPVSMYLAKKKSARFPLTAPQIIERATDKGGCSINGTIVKLTEDEAHTAMALITELIPSVNQTHVAALDGEANGILAQTRTGLQTGQKREIDKSDQWLMAQFPSFPMDTQLEKSQAQLIKAMDHANGNDIPEGYVSAEEYEEIKKQNETLLENQAGLDDRMRMIEQSMAAGAGEKPAGT